MIPSFRQYVMHATRYPNLWITIRKSCWNTIGNAKNAMETVWLAVNQATRSRQTRMLPNVYMASSVTRRARIVFEKACSFKRFG